MHVVDINKLKFPIGKFIKPANIDKSIVDNWINDIEKFPNELKELTENLDLEKLNWKYRPDGWTIKQVVHHCADSHMNSLIRFKLTLTEKKPIIKPYFEDRWAKLSDSISNNIEDSLMLLTALHKKWTYLLRNLDDEQLDLEFVHPEGNQTINIAENIGIYAWHSNHHLAHVKQALQYKGSFNSINS
jgi:DinB superfamily